MNGRWFTLIAGAALVSGCALPVGRNTAEAIVSQQYANLVPGSSRAVPPGPNEPSEPIRLVFTPAPGSTVSADQVPTFEVDPTWPRQFPEGWNWWRPEGDDLRPLRR